MDDLSVVVAHSDSDHAVVAVAGEIDMATAPRLRSDLTTVFPIYDSVAEAIILS